MSTLVSSLPFQCTCGPRSLATSTGGEPNTRVMRSARNCALRVRHSCSSDGDSMLTKRSRSATITSNCAASVARTCAAVRWSSMPRVMCLYSVGCPGRDLNPHSHFWPGGFKPPASTISPPGHRDQTLAQKMSRCLGYVRVRGGIFKRQPQCSPHTRSFNR